MAGPLLRMSTSSSGQMAVLAARLRLCRPAPRLMSQSAVLRAEISQPDPSAASQPPTLSRNGVPKPQWRRGQDAHSVLRAAIKAVSSIYDSVYHDLDQMGTISGRWEFNPIFRAFITTLFPPRQGRDESDAKTIRPIRQAILLKYEKHGDSPIVTSAARQAFYSWLARSQYRVAPGDNKFDGADLRHPHEWYPQSRMQKRVVHLHVGPTNSGKTYHALKRLEAAKTGIFCGPLRLLAHEVYTRLNSAGVPCSLLTGDERRFPADAAEPPRKLSCTVEMAPMVEVDVAVVDEIQMIGHSERGWAWTGILLGSPAKEIHLCGESRAVPVVSQIVRMLGDDLVVHNYSRLSPLRVMGESLGEDFMNLRKGDCIVLFNVLAIHEIRRQVEERTGLKTAIIYGSLPPETRAQQAQLFNDPDSGYDILIASDAIGMGLNLAIRRVIFFSLLKHDGEGRRGLTESEIKQIAGRAGRYKPPVATTESTDATEKFKRPDENAEQGPDQDDQNPNRFAASYQPDDTTGWVTTFLPTDFPFLVQGMEDPAEPISTAGLQPPTALLRNFAESFHPNTPFPYILERLQQVAELSPFFHVCSFRSHIMVAEAIQDVPLSIHDRIIMSVSPVGRHQEVLNTVVEYATVLSENRSITILDLPSIKIELLDEEPTGKPPELRQLEWLHQKIVNFLWLSFQFPSTFRGRALATEAKFRAEQRINLCLERFSDPALLRRLQKARQIMDERKKGMDEYESIEEVGHDLEFPPDKSVDGEAGEENKAKA